MSEPRTPQVPMVDGDGKPFYPLTQYNQIVMPDGSRWDGKGGGAQIDDTSASTEKVYSSQKVEAIASQLSEQMIDYWKTVYPVGSIYMSVIETSPALLFGGTWEQIKGRFLIGTGRPENNSSGASPGDYEIELNHRSGHATNTLSVSGNAKLYASSSGEVYVGRGGTYKFVPTHKINVNSVEGYSGTDEKVSGIAVYGEASGNTLPPYIAVNMWKRIPDEEVA